MSQVAFLSACVVMRTPGFYMPGPIQHRTLTRRRSATLSQRVRRWIQAPLSPELGEGLEVRAVVVKLPFLVQIDRDAVDAPALAAGLDRTVVEDVSEVGMATSAARFGADHAMGAILQQLDRTGQRFGEA